MTAILLRLPTAIHGPCEADFFAAVLATTPEQQEAVRKALDALVEGGQLRREGSRFYLPEAVPCGPLFGGIQ